ncbi:phosphate ABC transporter substrate-binding protein [Halodesulfovibrio marinisediminis]|uniref:Phosphate ABC transporter substrate-binding protein, PhoT family (TC 3.A.1.7.1) n=1 Tax=Halodesulfovibrio marinisediminis DSM 17456 TaxID=1121457 RepID=A0A1N6E7U2_9BACT|nr:phosphate ABC transporter substrate-binding protein [Halodesulfovibrio marinisediminis]SIN79066.1 phosphate ABC transporter substrate-binding protein, PhoT family (TC 3.A.1.7.1) [Halodesulfovibrio marinisediminis DSM 17456]
MKFNKIFALLSIFTLSLCTSAFASGLDAFVNQSGTITIAGGTAHIPVMKAAAKRIMIKNSDIRITIAGGGSGVGIQKVGEGLVDIGNAGRATSDKEKAKYTLTSYPFAVDGVATVLSAKNPVSALTTKQIQDVFAGKITNWKELGGKDASIHIYTRDEASGTRSVYWKKLLKKGKIVDSANVVASNGAMKVAIAQDPDGIGFIGIGTLDNTVKAPTLDGVSVSQETAKNGTYKIVRKLYMNTNGAPSGIVKSFIDYILSDECTDIIVSSGYLPLN